MYCQNCGSALESGRPLLSIVWKTPISSSTPIATAYDSEKVVLFGLANATAGSSKRTAQTRGKVIWRILAALL